MYLDSQDYQTIWKLAHNWSNTDPESTNENSLTPETKIFIHRIMSAINQSKITVRSRRFQIFQDESVFSFIVDFNHFRKFSQCLKKDIFIKAYLESLYVRRSDVLTWCDNDFLSPPPIWQIKNNQLNSVGVYDSSDDENEGWYKEISDTRKKRVACLELAKKLWQISPHLTYEEIYNHEIMKQYGYHNVFSLAAFKKWARPFAPDQAKLGGRPIKNR